MQGFQGQTCASCFNSYEYYPDHNIVPPCPCCGANGSKPLTAEEFYKALGVNPSK